MRITRLLARNFLSLENVEVELGGLNVLVGPNASGKSNFVRALQTLAHHARYGTPMTLGYRSFRDIAYRFDETASVVLEVEGEEEGRSMRYTLELTARDYSERAMVDGWDALDNKGSGSRARILTLGGRLDILDKDKSMIGRTTYFQVQVYRSVLAGLPPYAARELHVLADTLRGITVHSFDPDILRGSVGVEGPPVLGYRGEAFARFLLHLYLEDRRRFSMVEEAMQSLVPEIEEIIPRLERDHVEVWLRVKGLPGPLKPQGISEGTLRMLAYVTALYSGASIAVFEEPESCVHPHLLESLIDLARKAPCQVVITTHSPYLLDHVEPEEVYVVEKPKTATVIRKLSGTRELQAVKKLLEQGGTLGEAWYSGLMGGVPETTLP